MSAVDTAYIGRLGADLGGGTVCFCVRMFLRVGVLGLGFDVRGLC